MQDFEKDLKDIANIYRHISDKGIDKWLEDIEPASVFDTDMELLFAPGLNDYASTTLEESLTIGSELQKIKRSMAIIKYLLERSKKAYENYKTVKYNPKANPIILEWLEAHEKAHPEVLDSTPFTKRCIVCGKEFEAKTTRALYCSQSCSKKAVYARKQQQEARNAAL